MQTQYTNNEIEQLSINGEKTVKTEQTMIPLELAIKKRNNNIKIIKILAVTILIVLSFIIFFFIGYFISKNINNQITPINISSKCPESNIKMIDSNGTTYNLEHFLKIATKESNETYSDNIIHLLVDDIIISLLNKNTNEKTNNESSNHRRLAVSKWYGGYSGSFSTIYRSGKKIIEICIRSGVLIDAIRVRFEDGYMTPKYGGNGGSESCYKAPNNCITGGRIRHGALIDGMSVYGGSWSRWFGGNGGSFESWSTSGRCLRKIKLRYSSSDVVHGIQFEWW